MPRFLSIPPEEISRARALYEGTEIPVRDIAKMLGIGLTTLHRKINRWGWVPRNARLRGLDAAAKADIPVEEIAALAAPHVVTVEKETLIDRVRAAVEREIVAIEAVLTRVEGARLRSSDAERAARTLATLVKTMREVAALQRDEKPETEIGESGQESGRDEFRDLEAFRAELAERLDRLRRSGNAQ
jgi:hypothetical protein